MTLPVGLVKLNFADGAPPPTVGAGKLEPVMGVEVGIVINSSFVPGATVSLLTGGTDPGGPATVSTCASEFGPEGNTPCARICCKICDSVPGVTVLASNVNKSAALSW